MSETMSALQSLLASPASCNQWWKTVNLVVLAESSEREALQTSLLEYTETNEEWSRVRVPCGDWEQDFAGWELCQLQEQSVAGFPDWTEIESTEIFCPPGSFLMGSPEKEEEDENIPEEQPQRKVSLSRGFWAMTTPVSMEMLCGECRLLHVAIGSLMRAKESSHMLGHARVRKTEICYHLSAK